ncbi:MAG: hypothetical protein CME94_06310 [Hyphomonadaceae bacterium]|nr:hypothetical protein [Hyphomonadaceae bacterium]
MANRGKLGWMTDSGDRQEADARTAPRRNRRGERTRKTLLDATVKSLHQRGYGGTTVEAVMNDTGISRGSVLNQFPTRLDLIIAAAEHGMSEMIGHTSGELETYDDAAACYRAFCDITWRSYQLPAASAVTETLLAARWDKELAAAFRPIAERVETEIDGLVARIATQSGIADIDGSIVHARILILSLRGITLELAYDPGRPLILRALERIRAEHAAHCDTVLPVG